MEIVLTSVILSAVTTIVITAISRKKVMTYVNEMCDITTEQAEKIKECAISNVETLVSIVNQNRPG